VPIDDEESYFDFNRANYGDAASALQAVNWADVFSGVDLTNKVERFYSVLANVVSNHVPLRRRRHKYCCHWMTPQLARLRNQRNRSFKRYQRTGSNADLNASLYKEYEHQQALLVYSDPKQFWKVINKRRGVDGVPRRMQLEDKLGENLSQTAELFADFFQSVFVVDDDVDNIVLPSGPSPATLCDLRLCEDVVLQGLNQLNVNKGAGPDQLPNRFLKSLATGLAHPLCHLFNASLESGEFPAIWKSAFLTPIFKSGMRSDVTNYRGVVVLSAVPKLFEKLVCDAIEPLLSPIINPNQHGFMKGRSTCSNLVVYVHRLLKSISGCHIYGLRKSFRSSESPIVAAKIGAGWCEWDAEMLDGQLPAGS
jgi:hypothetical protein